MGSKRGKIKNFSGMTFGELDVIRDSMKRSSCGAVVWECLCSCGCLVGRVGATLSGGRSRSCGHLKVSPAAIAKRSIKRRIEDAPIREYFRNYRASARTRKLDFVLTYEQFQELVTKNCYYCGDNPNLLMESRFDKKLLNGIDRMDNSLGYSLANCVPCCRVCNKIKSAMGHDSFIEHAHKISQYMSYRGILNIA